MAIHPLKSGSNWNLEMLVFEERGKPEYPEKNLSEQRREPTTTTIMVEIMGKVRVQGTSSFDKRSKESNDLTCGQEGSSWN